MTTKRSEGAAWKVLDALSKIGITDDVWFEADDDIAALPIEQVKDELRGSDAQTHMPEVLRARARSLWGRHFDQLAEGALSAASPVTDTRPAVNDRKRPAKAVANSASPLLSSPSPRSSLIAIAMVQKGEDAFYVNVLRHAHQKKTTLPAEAVSLLASSYTLDLAKFFYCLDLDGIARRGNLIRQMLDAHNKLVAHVTTDPGGLAQLPWVESQRTRLATATFTSEQISRTVAISSNGKISFEDDAIEKIMCLRAVLRGVSDEGSRKLIVCLSDYGFLKRITAGAAAVVESTGRLETFYRQFVDHVASEYHGLSATDDELTQPASFSA